MKGEERERGWRREGGAVVRGGVGVQAGLRGPLARAA